MRNRGRFLAPFCFILALARGEQPRITPLVTIHADDTSTVAAMKADRQGNLYIAGTTFASNLGTSGAYRSAPRAAPIYKVNAEGWVPMRVPGLGGTGFRIAASATDPKRILLGTSRGVRVSLDGGNNWETQLSCYSVGPIAISPSNPDIAYARVSPRAGCQLGVGFVRSADGGRTWDARTAPSPADQIAIDPYHPNHLFVGSLHSEDGGLQWKETEPGPFQVFFDPKREGVVYGVGPYFYRSVDGGLRWVRIDPGVRFVDVLMDPLRARTLYARTAASPVIWISVDDGESWEPIRPLPDAWNIESWAMLPNGRMLVIRANGTIRTVQLYKDGSVELSVRQEGLLGPSAVSGDAVLLLGTPQREGFLAKVSSEGELLFATYVGGSSQVDGLAVDASGIATLVGRANSSDFPVTQSVERVPSGFSDEYRGFVMRFSAEGELIYSTGVPGFLSAVVLGADGSAYFGGASRTGFPATAGAIQQEFNGLSAPSLTDALLGKLSSNGRTLEFGTYLGVAGRGVGALLLEENETLIIGAAYVGRVEAAGTRYTAWQASPGDIIGGNIFGLARAGDSILATGSTNRLTANEEAFQPQPPPFYGTLPAFNGRTFPSVARDAFVCRLAGDGSILYATYLGGERIDEARAMVADEEGHAIVAGYTDSRAFPTRSLLQAPMGSRSGFVAKLNARGTDLRYSTYWGSEATAELRAILPHPQGGYWIAGTDGLDIVVSRLEEVPASAVRIDAVESASTGLQGPLQLGERVRIRGAGFTKETIVYLNGRAVSSSPEEAAHLIILLPESLLDGNSMLTFQVDDSNLVKVPVERLPAPIRP